MNISTIEGLRPVFDFYSIKPRGAYAWNTIRQFLLQNQDLVGVLDLITSKIKQIAGDALGADLHLAQENGVQFLVLVPHALEVDPGLLYQLEDWFAENEACQAAIGRILIADKWEEKP